MTQLLVRHPSHTAQNQHLLTPQSCRIPILRLFATAPLNFSRTDLFVDIAAQDREFAGIAIIPTHIEIAESLLVAGSATFG